MNAKLSSRAIAAIRAQRGELSVVVAITVVAGLLRFYRIDEKSIWLDESFSLWIARQSLWDGWRWLIDVDQHPPLYYSLLHLWIRLVGSLEGPVRALSAIASTLTIPVFYAACKRLLDRPTATLAVGILALSPFHVQFAQEARMYALLTLEVASVFYFLARLATSPVPEGRDWVGLSVSQALVMLTHNTAAVFLPAALNGAAALIFLLFPSGVGRGFGNGQHVRQQGSSQPDESDECDSSRESSPAASSAQAQTGSGSERMEPDPESFWRNWVRFQALALLLWLPWAVPFIIQVIDVGSGFWLPPPWPGLVLDTFRNFHFSFLPSELPLRPMWMWGYGALAAVGLVSLFTQGSWPSRVSQRHRLRGQEMPRGRLHPETPSADSDRAAILLFCLFAVPHVVALLVSLRSPIYAERPLIWTTLPYFALIAAGIRALGGSLWMRLAEVVAFPRAPGLSALASTAGLGLQTLFLAAIIGLSALSLNGYYFWFQKEAWDDAAAHIAQQAQPGDMIVFNATWVQIPFAYYFERYGLDTELKGLPVDLFEGGELEPRMEEDDVPHIQELLAGRDRVWLVYSHNWYSDPDGIIPRELARIFAEAQQAEFVGIQIIHFSGRK